MNHLSPDAHNTPRVLYSLLLSSLWHSTWRSHLEEKGLSWLMGQKASRGFWWQKASPSWNIWDRGVELQPEENTTFKASPLQPTSAGQSTVPRVLQALEMGPQGGTRWSNAAARGGIWTLKHYKSAPLLSWSYEKEMEEYRSQVIYSRADC